MRRALLLSVAVALALAGCGAAGTVPHPGISTATILTPTSSPVPTPPPHCTPRGALPDPACTPGVANPLVTTATLSTTMCAKGWATTQHPPQAWTEALKRRMVRAYYPRGTSLTLFILDALIPVEAGGDHWAVGNMWLEPKAESLVKDRVEDAARRAVCRKVASLPLATAQHAIATNWQAFGRSLGVRIP